mgnify:CR=1 FL=1
MIVITRKKRWFILEWHVGCSGWNYKGWGNVFYPIKMPESRQLSYYSSVFDTVEINSTFYNIPSKTITRGWYERTTEDFIFTVKTFRGITHEIHQRLNKYELEPLLAKFYDSIIPLKDKLHAILYQFPPSFTLNRFKKDFFKLVDMIPLKIPVAFEFREKNWFHDEYLLQMIKGENLFSIAGSVHHSIIKPFIETTGSQFLFRFIGDRTLTTFGKIQRDRKEEMQRIKKIIDNKIQGIRDIFIYFNNHYAGFGPESANIFHSW